MPVVADAQHVDEIDVVAVDLRRDRDWGTWKTVPGDVIGTWNGELLTAVLGLVVALPEAEPARCFTPRYAICLRTGPLVGRRGEYHATLNNATDTAGPMA